jgi:hypothetical protein
MLNNAKAQGTLKTINKRINLLNLKKRIKI